MDDHHNFILKPGVWFGEGKIQLNMIEEDLLFQTTWTVLEEDASGKIHCIQEIHIDGLSENMKNDLTFFDIQPESFSVEMSNQNIEKIIGEGIIDDNMVAWEFQENGFNFEGFEVYHRSEDGGYKMHAEYVTSDQFRTKIVGGIRVKTAQDRIELKDNEREEEL